MQDAIARYAHMLRRTLSETPNHAVDLDEAYGLLPPQLREKIHPDGPVDLPKVLLDHVGGADANSSLGRTMVRLKPPDERDPPPPRPCAYWDVAEWGRCRKGAMCDFKHALTSRGFSTGRRGWL